MSNVQGRDDDSAIVLFGVSHLDGTTPVQINFDPSTRTMLVDTTTSIAFSSTLYKTQNSLTGFPFANATSSSNNKTVAPWVVNANTGALLISYI